jgi:hypothetical protein
MRLLLALVCLVSLAACAQRPPMDRRLITTAADGELISEIRDTWNGRVHDRDLPFAAMERAVEITDELARRWGVPRITVQDALRGIARSGCPTHVAILAWGQPLSVTQDGEVEVWHYRAMAGSGPRYLRVSGGTVVEVVVSP